MFRSALRAAGPSSTRRIAFRPVAARRFLSTAPPQEKSRSWKSSLARWGLAGAVVYYYNTAALFAEETTEPIRAVPDAVRSSETFDTVESVTQQRRAEAQAQAKAQIQTQTQPSTGNATSVAASDAVPAAPGSPDGLEAEAEQQGAFNEETGEINWDCPCLGGMANGPCGEQFRAAFSCFVFSKEEPKGVDCIEHFKTMQDCFRQHPDVYGGELDDDEEGMPGPEEQHSDTASYSADPTPASPTDALSGHRGEKVLEDHNAQPDSQDAISGKRARAEAAKEQVRSSAGSEVSEAPSAVPKSAHDAR